MNKGRKSHGEKGEKEENELILSNLNKSNNTRKADDNLVVVVGQP